jgi:phosphopantetheinyl transferase
MIIQLIDDTFDTQTALNALPHTAQQDILKYRRPEDQNARIISHQMKEFLSGGRLITRTKYGKPVCDGVWFNVSHDGKCVVGIAAETPVGIDVMDTRTWRDIPAFHNALTPFEREYIGDDLRRFYRIWTAKEAFLKMLGTGLCSPMELVEIREGGVFFHGLRQNVTLRHERMDHYQVAICHNVI